MTGRRKVSALITAHGSPALLSIAGHPLVEHSIRQALAARLVEKTVVATDLDEVAALAVRLGAGIWRGDGLAGFRETPDAPEMVVVLDAATPLRQPGDIDAAIAMVAELGLSSLVSVTAMLGTLRRGDGSELPDRPAFAENGSIRIERLGVADGRVPGIFPMERHAALRGDHPEDRLALEALLRRPHHDPATWPERIELVVFDFDGVMTDNRVTTDAAGQEYVTCHRGDGMGVARLREAGLAMLILSTEENPVVAARARKLRLPVAHAVADKATYLAAMLAERNVDAQHVAYLGNDINDAGCLAMVGFPIVVSDAHPDVFSLARLTLSAKGGHGAVREFCDLLDAHYKIIDGAALRP